MISPEKYKELKTSGNLPSPKGVALRVLDLLRQEDPNIQDIAQAIKADPVLSSRLIQLANGLVAYQTRPIASIKDAITVMGFNVVQQLITGLSLIENTQSGPCRKFNYQTFWLHSLLSAITAQHLVRHNRLGSAEEVFVLGLMSKIGTLALATAYPVEYARILDVGNTLTPVKQVELERSAFGFCHNQLSQAMLADWGLPRVFQEAVLHHEHPERTNCAVNSRDWLLLHILYTASLLASTSLSTEPVRRKLVPKLILGATRLGIESEALAKLGDLSIQEWVEWSKLCGLRTSSVPTFSTLLQAVPLTTDMVEVGEALPHDSGSFYKLNILLVDDDPAILFLLKSLLEKAGHSVVCAHNGEEALAMIEKSPPQLIMTDWIMPKMDGLQFCKELRKNPQWRTIYIFILTAQESTDRLVEAFEAGANDYMTKPIDPKVLGARLRAGQRVVHLQDELEFERKQLHQFGDELAVSNRRLQQQALTDALTGLPNRRFAGEQMERQWTLAERNHNPLSCMMLDIDHFKRINESYGHQAGDQVLKQLANTLRNNTHSEDTVCRVDGAEFLLICPGSTPEQAYRKAEQLRHCILELRIRNDEGRLIPVTASIAVASKQPGMADTNALLSLLDHRLMEARRRGRNCSVGN